MTRVLASLLITFSLIGCASRSNYHHLYATSVAERHEAERWHDADVFKTDLKLTFGGNTRLVGTMWYETSTGRARIETSDGLTMVWDGETAWVAPEDTQYDRPRFDILTWPYFLALPYKLRDAGTRIVPAGIGLVHGRKYDAARLTFGEGVGDSPDDWYIIYTSDLQRVEAVAYIVTYGKSGDEARNAEPHAMTYEQYRYIERVPVAHRWRFYDWSEADGVHGDPHGEALLTNTAFVETRDELFERPPNSREATMPDAE